MRPRLITISIIILLISLACKSGEQIARDRAINAAKTAVSGEQAANMLVSGQALDNVMPQLVAIDNVISNAPGSWMLVNDAQKLAVFISNAGKAANGASFFFVGIVDTEGATLVNNAEVFTDLGIDFSRIKTLEELQTILRNRGFVQMTAASLPFLYSTLQAAMSFISKLGSSISDVMVIPAGMLTPEDINPWCLNEMMNCGNMEGIDS